MTEQNSAHTVCLSNVVRISLIATETDGCAGECKGSVAHHPFTDSIAYTGRSNGPHFRLASALTMGYHTSLWGPQSIFS